MRRRLSAELPVQAAPGRGTSGIEMESLLTLAFSCVLSIEFTDEHM